MSSEHIKIIAENRKARHNYTLETQYEAGLALVGTEVKSLRMGIANLKDSYARIKDGEIYIYQMHIGQYPYSHYDNHVSLRPRKLLLHNYEIKKLTGKINERGYSLVPLRLYFKNGKVKILIALARGKRSYDKRQAIKERDIGREMDRERKNY